MLSGGDFYVFGVNPLGSVIYPEKFAVSGRSRLDKSAEVSACKRHMPDTCAFVPTSCKTFPDKLLEVQID